MSITSENQEKRRKFSFVFLYIKKIFVYYEDQSKETLSVPKCQIGKIKCVRKMGYGDKVANFISLIVQTSKVNTFAILF